VRLLGAVGNAMIELKRLHKGEYRNSRDKDMGLIKVYQSSGNKWKNVAAFLMTRVVCGDGGVVAPVT
jgi:hypothetical protein